jgi:hypothetical protein
VTTTTRAAAVAVAIIRIAMIPLREQTVMVMEQCRGIAVLPSLSRLIRFTRLSLPPLLVSLVTRLCEKTCRFSLIRRENIPIFCFANICEFHFFNSLVDRNLIL